MIQPFPDILTSCLGEENTSPTPIKMAKKKKTALPTVNRGFATTSQPKKPEPIAPEPAPTEEAVVQAVAGEGPNSGTQNGTEGEKKPGDEDWDDESKLEDAVYQGYVERLQDKGDREVARILKVCLTLIPT